MKGRRAWTAAAAAAIVSLGLGGCAVGPDFKRPAMFEDVERYSSDALEAGPKSGIGQRIVLGAPIARDWWKPFASAELDRVVDAALSGNRTLAAASSRAAASRELVAAVSGTRSPQVSLTAGAGRQKYGVAMLGDFAKPPPFTYFSIGPAVSYAFDYTGGTARAVERESALAAVAEQQANAAYLEVTGNAVVLSLRIVSLRHQITTARALLDQDRENVALVKKAFEAGTVSRLDVVAAESELAADETALPPLRKELGVVRHALAVLAGNVPSKAQPPEVSSDRLALPDPLPVSVPSELAHRRPDILAAEAQLHAATAAVGVAEANLYPRITLTASAGQQSTELAHLFDRASSAWGIAGNLVAPLFDGGTLRAQKRAAIQTLGEARANYEQTVLAAFGQVADALGALESDADELSAQTRARDAAMANLDLTRRSYAEGNTTVLQVLDAQRSLQRAELGFVRAMWQRYVDTAQLYLALGGGDAGT